MYVCYSWLSPHSMYSLASQMKHSPLFSQREKAKIQREIKADVSYGHCCLFVCVCVFLGTVYKGASGKSSNTA